MLNSTSVLSGQDKSTEACPLRHRKPARAPVKAPDAATFQGDFSLTVPGVPVGVGPPSHSCVCVQRSVWAPRPGAERGAETSPGYRTFEVHRGVAPLVCTIS